MTIKKILGITFLATMALSQTVMATPNEDTSEMTQIDLLENISQVYIEDQEITEVEPEVSEEVEVAGTVTKVIVEEAKVRDKASEEADIINYLGEGEEIVAVERIDNWYFIQTENLEGYVYKTQIDETELSMLPYTRTETNELAVEETYLGEEVVSYARQFLGNPYVYGGNSLTRGTDCSGFTSQVYKNFGIKLQRSSRSQYTSNGYKVSKKDLLPGDLVFYGYNGNIDHVAIYAGNGEIVHASTPKTGIKMSKLEYGKPIIGIKRVI